ncbi:hypothetical protein ACQ4PT_005793 [Festuca glaucescens]
MHRRKLEALVFMAGTIVVEAAQAHPVLGVLDACDSALCVQPRENVQERIRLTEEFSLPPKGHRMNRDKLEVLLLNFGDESKVMQSFVLKMEAFLDPYFCISGAYSAHHRRMFDALSSQECEPQILSKTAKFALVFRLSALSSIQVNNKTITGAILALPVLKEITVILTSDEEDTDGDN